MHCTDFVIVVLTPLLLSRLKKNGFFITIRHNHFFYQLILHVVVFLSFHLLIIITSFSRKRFQHYEYIISCLFNLTM